MRAWENDEGFNLWLEAGMNGSDVKHQTKDECQRGSGGIHPK